MTFHTTGAKGSSLPAIPGSREAGSPHGWISSGRRSMAIHCPRRTDPSFFVSAGIEGRTESEIGDVRDLAALSKSMMAFDPDLVFHLAAQPLVRLSYERPVETFETNVMGTVNVLEALRGCPRTQACVMITSDKCYQNNEWVYSYRENDAMGGHDPYSASKGAAEIVIGSYRSSYFSGAAKEGNRCGVASARAGNVIGGGDWASDRIVPGQHPEPEAVEADRGPEPDGGAPMAARHGATVWLPLPGPNH